MLQETHNHCMIRDAYPGISTELLPWFRSVLPSVGCNPDSKGLAVIMTLERLEPGMGSRAGNGTARPRVSLATLTVSNTRFCWALSGRDGFITITVIQPSVDTICGSLETVILNSP